MALSYLKVVGVVSRCDLYAAGSKFLIYIRVCNNRNLPVSSAEASAILPTRSLYRSSSGLTATAVSPSMVSGRVVAISTNLPSSPTIGIVDVPEMAFLLYMLYLCIRNGGLGRPDTS